MAPNVADGDSGRDGRGFRTWPTLATTAVYAGTTHSRRVETAYDAESETLTVEGRAVALPDHVYNLRAFDDIVVAVLASGGLRFPSPASLRAR